MTEEEKHTFSKLPENETLSLTPFLEDFSNIRGHGIHANNHL